MNNEGNSTQPALIRGLILLETIMAADKPLTSAYLAEDLDLPKATVHRIAQQLEDEGYLQREPKGKRFVGGPRLRKLATSILSNSVINANRHQVLQRLSEEINETINLTALDGNEVIYLDRVESNWPVRIYLPIGSHVPLHCTATGKLFIANMKPAWQRRFLKSTTLTKYTDKTVVSTEDLKEQLERISTEDYGFDIGEYIDGMIALSVPVKDESGNVCYAIAVHAPSARIKMDALMTFLPLLRDAATKISELISD